MTSSSFFPALTPDALATLRASHSPQAHRGQSGIDRLIISWEPSPNPLSAAAGPACFIISDFGGYLCSTTSLYVLQDLILLEHHGGRGSVRTLVTGKDFPSDPLLNPRAAPRATSAPIPDLDAAIEAHFGDLL